MSCAPFNRVKQRAKLILEHFLRRKRKPSDLSIFEINPSCSRIQLKVG